MGLQSADSGSLGPASSCTPEGSSSGQIGPTPRVLSAPCRHRSRLRRVRYRCASASTTCVAASNPGPNLVQAINRRPNLRLFVDPKFLESGSRRRGRTQAYGAVSRRSRWGRTAAARSCCCRSSSTGSAAFMLVDLPLEGLGWVAGIGWTKTSRPPPSVFIRIIDAPSRNLMAA